MKLSVLLLSALVILAVLSTTEAKKKKKDEEAGPCKVKNCTKCRKTFVVTKHYYDHLNEKGQCPGNQTRRAFKLSITEEKTKPYYDVAHEENGKAIYKCKECGELFLQNAFFAMHLRRKHKVEYGE